MSSAEFEPAITATEWLQNYALDSTATGVGWIQIMGAADSLKLTIVDVWNTWNFKLCTAYDTMVGCLDKGAAQVVTKCCVNARSIFTLRD